MEGAGTAAFRGLVSPASARGLDDPITGLPIWPRMETDVAPLTGFEGRVASVRPRLEQPRETIGTAERMEGKT